jgi:hypothetical protein
MLLIIGSVSAEELYVPSTALGGVKYTVASSGMYRVTYVDGVARGPDTTPTGDCGYCSPRWPCYTNQIFIYKNREVSWGPSTHPPECQTVPVSPDYSLGDGNYYTSLEAVKAAQGGFFDVSLKKGDWLIFTILDMKNSYDTNLGGMTIKISQIQPEVIETNTVSMSTSFVPSTTSAPIITISPADQVPKTNSGDSGSYVAIIIVLIIILCVGGVYSLHMIRKKNSGDVIYPDQKPLFRSTSSSTTTDNTIKFRHSSFENESTHHDIFVSYSSEDKPIADAICNHLESRHIRCWVAPRDILPGMNYQEAIIDAIDSSSIMVLVFSSHSNESPHVLTEVNEAMSNGVIIIPFRIENILPSKAMKYLISGPHWLDAMTPPLEKHILELEETVRILIERKQQKSK